uniref:Uncharacterized protein n=1 Tax=Rhodnius prolixus TaxID=13249 RepID=T1H8F6_RHOPR
MSGTTKALYLELNEREQLVEELTRKSTQLIEDIENVRKKKLSLLNDLSEKELKLHNLKEESENVCQILLINSQINDLLRMEDDLLSKKLYFEKSIELKCNQQEELKKKIEESEILLNEILNKSSQELQMKVELDEIYNKTCKMLEEAKINLLSSISTEKIDNSEKRLKELEDLYSKHKEELAKLNNELECVDSANTLVMKEYDDILGEQSRIVEKQKTLLLEKDKQNVHLLSMENLKKYLSDLEDEYFSLLSSKEANLVLDELKEELDKIMLEHKIGEQCNNDQLDSISDSFNSQLKILNDRMNTMKSENEEAIKKKIIQSTRFRKAIPKIEEAVKSAKNLISEKIPLLIGCIDKRLEYINNLIEVYKAARLEYKGSNGKNIDAKVVMNSIEKSLGKVMEHMAAVYEGPKLNASENLNKYQQLTELAACIYGGLGIPPRISMNESTQSSQRYLIEANETIFRLARERGYTIRSLFVALEYDEPIKALIKIKGRLVHTLAATGTAASVLNLVWQR